MLVDERKQVRASMDPVKRRSLARPFRSGRECRMFVEAEVSRRGESCDEAVAARDTIS
jgi:hypothetical protein